MKPHPPGPFGKQFSTTTHTTSQLHLFRDGLTSKVSVRCYVIHSSQSQYGATNVTLSELSYFQEGYTPSHASCHSIRNPFGHKTAEIWHISWTRRYHLQHPTTLPRGCPTPSPPPLHRMPQIYSTSTEMATANCVVIPKPGKMMYSHPKSYCPISLQSCFRKLLESIVAKRLSHVALMCGVTHPSQMGAQQGKFCN